MTTKTLKGNILILLIMAILFSSCEEEIICDNFLQTLTNCSTQNWKVVESINQGSSVASEINEIWSFSADETYTRTTVSGVFQYGHNSTILWLGASQTGFNTYTYAFSNNNTVFEIIKESTTAQDGAYIRRIKFVKQ